MNADNYNLPINNSESYQIKIGNETGTSSKCEKLLGVKTDRELNFNKHHYVKRLARNYKLSRE